MHTSHRPDRPTGSPHVAMPIRLLALLALLTTGLLGALAGPAIAAGTSPMTSVGASAAADTGWLRAGHLAPGTGKADIRLTPYSGGDPLLFPSVSYGDITDYRRVSAGLYTVAFVPAGADMSVTPMLSKTVRVSPGSASTVVASGSAQNLTAQVIIDDLTPPPAGQANVRLLSAAGGSQQVTAQVVGGPLLAEDVTAGSATGYAAVNAQTYSIEVTSSDDSATPTSNQVSLQPGGVYTLLVVDNPHSGLALSGVQDSVGSRVMPTGAVDTGGGGLAAEPGVTGDQAATGAHTIGAVPRAGLAAACLVLLAGATLAWSRRRVPGAGSDTR